MCTAISVDTHLFRKKRRLTSEEVQHGVGGVGRERDRERERVRERERERGGLLMRGVGIFGDLLGRG